MKNYFYVWRRTFDFSGKLGRGDYWLFICINVLVSGLLCFLNYCVSTGATLTVGLLPIVFAALTFLPTFSATVRRLHDTSRSGWWIAVSLIPVVGGILLLLYLAQRTTAETEYENRGIGAVEIDEEFDPESVFGKEYWNVEEDPIAEGEEAGEALSVENHVPGKIF